VATKQVPIKESTEDEAAISDLAELNDAEDGELFRAMEEARSTQGSEVILTRTMPADRAGFCDKIPVAEFDLAGVKSKYGPGTYRIRFRGPSGFIKGGATIKVAPIPESKAAAPGDFTAMLELMDRRQAESRAQFNDWIKLLIPIVGGIVTAWIARPVPQTGPDIAGLVTALKPAPGPTLTDLTAMMANMKSLTSAPESGTMIDTVFKAFEFAKEMGTGGGEGKGETNWLDILKEVIQAAPGAIRPMLEARMAQMQAGRQPAQAPQAIPAVSSAAPPVTSADSVSVSISPTMENSRSTMETSPPATGENNFMKTLWEPVAKQHLAKVAGWAEKDRDPQVYAEVFVDELPDLSAYFTPAQILEHLQNSVWFEKVCELEPRLKNHSKFCNDIRLAVIDIVEDIKDQMEEEKAVSDKKMSKQTDESFEV
jgi:hypothetical protein